MINLGKKNILGIGIDAIDYEEAVSQIVNAAHERKPLTVTALAVHGVMTGVLNEIQRRRLNELDIITPDGQPVRWALNLLYKTNLSDRVYGPTLMQKVCQRAAEESLPIYLYGSYLDNIRALEKNLKKQFPKLNIVGSKPSLFRHISIDEQRSIAAEITGSGASIVFVGLGCPRQEVWVYENKQYISMPLIAVGAAFDFHAGTLQQAPVFMQDIGLEWLFRLIREPLRLWKRYLLLNPLYVFLLTLQIFKLKSFESQFLPQVEEIRYG